MIVVRTAAAVAIVLGSWSAASAADDQDALSRAKALYTAAAYDEALALLNEVNNPTAADGIEAKEYRAFCLLALGRRDDASKVIEEIVQANPSFQPSATQVSPRLQDAFRDVRRRVLPSIVRQTYADAKAAFDRKDFEAANIRFRTVVALMADADATGASELADLRILSNGFLDLIKTTPPVEAPAAAAAPPPQLPPPAPPPAPAIYDARNPDVVPPTPVAQSVPPWHPTKQETQVYDGTLTLVIDERGDVISVELEGNLNPAYAQLLRRAAARWKYQPATRNGVPVKYRRGVAVHLSPEASRQEG